MLSLTNLTNTIKSVATTLTNNKGVIASDLGVLAKDVAATVGGVTAKVISDPIGTAKYVIEDAEVALFGHNGPQPIRDTVSFVQGIAGLAADTALNVFNALPSTTTAPTFDVLPGNINAQPNKVITDTHYHSEASIGDLSWLIYHARTITNSEITDKWKIYRDDETSHGFNSRTYVDEANKQVAITLEGTQANSDLSPLWFSKDGLCPGGADLEIGLGVIPPQMREGYEQFKNIVADVESKYVSQGYGLSVAGHSLGGGLAQMMPGMYFIDTGKALPTIAEAGPGMLRALKLYAEEQLLAGQEIHLPTGGTYKLHSFTTLDKANEAKAVVNTFQADQFSNVVNLITELDPVGHVNYNIDRTKDGHVGVNMIVPYLLTTREDMQDVESVVMKPVDALNIVTPSQMPSDPLGLLPGLHDISVTRFDRHEPDQSCALWSGTTLGFKEFDTIGVGSAVYRNYGEPKKVWTGSQLNIAEVKLFGDATDNVIDATQKVAGKQNVFVSAGDGSDVVYGTNHGDMLGGGNGNDFIIGGIGDDYIAGDADNDQLSGGAGQDILFGGVGDDALDGGAGDDALIGGAGNDTLTWTAGNDIICGNEGDDTFVIKNGAVGNAQIKWERNFTNFGNDSVKIEGAIAKGSGLLLNFADEIRFQDMKWSVSGTDIIMSDNLGNQSASVVFKNAFDTFGKNNDKIDFSFTNGRLYLDDETYHVRAGAGTVTAIDDAKFQGKGNILVGSAGKDTLVAGKGNDLLFGGAGSDAFVFNNNFGNDAIIGSDGQDVVRFNNVFASTAFTAKQNGNDLVIDYRQAGLTTVNELTINNWFASGDKVNDFAFADGSHYKIQNNNFIKI